MISNTLRVISQWTEHSEWSSDNTDPDFQWTIVDGGLRVVITTRTIGSSRNVDSWQVIGRAQDNTEHLRALLQVAFFERVHVRTSLCRLPHICKANCDWTKPAGLCVERFWNRMKDDRRRWKVLCRHRGLPRSLWLSIMDRVCAITAQTVLPF